MNIIHNKDIISETDINAIISEVHQVATWGHNNQNCKLDNAIHRWVKNGQNVIKINIYNIENIFINSPQTNPLGVFSRTLPTWTENRFGTVYITPIDSVQGRWLLTIEETDILANNLRKNKLSQQSITKVSNMKRMLWFGIIFIVVLLMMEYMLELSKFINNKDFVAE